MFCKKRVWLFACCLLLFIPLPLFCAQPIGDIVITIPKSGTCFFAELIKALQIPVPVAHYFLDTEETQARFGQHYSHCLHTSKDFVGKTVVVIRDLHDTMPSTIFWLEKIFSEALQHSAHLYNLQTREAMRQFLQAPFEEQLLEVISLDGVCYDQMLLTQTAAQLVLELMEKQKESVFVIRFEDIIGLESGGYLSDTERVELIFKMCVFLGHIRQPYQIAEVLQTIFGHSITYNPIKIKVGRWRTLYNSNHLTAFDAHWSHLNTALGY